MHVTRLWAVVSNVQDLIEKHLAAFKAITGEDVDTKWCISEQVRARRLGVGLGRRHLHPMSGARDLKIAPRSVREGKTVG
eukprot:scaffold212226_cov20-Prasinocladus_malaysianus.AAC.1